MSKYLKRNTNKTSAYNKLTSVSLVKLEVFVSVKMAFHFCLLFLLAETLLSGHY